MNKLLDLRQTLFDCGQSIQPENLTVLSKSGKITHHYHREYDKGNNKFKKTYDIEIFVFDISSDIDAILYTVCQWLTKNQPGHDEGNISYELDILNHNSADLMITIKDITEVITATTNDKGTYLGACAPEVLDPIVRKEGLVSISNHD